MFKREQALSKSDEMEMTGERLLTVGICDDNKGDLKRIKEEAVTRLEKRGVKCEIFLYSNGLEMFNEPTKCKFDLVFLDLEMPGLNGFQLAERLRMANPDTEIVFVSMHESLVFSSFQYTPLWFVRKERLHDDMARAIQKYRKKTAHTKIPYQSKDGNGHGEIWDTDICYLECFKHTITIVAVNGSKYQKYGVLKEWEIKLEEYGFIRVHKSFLVNLRWVDHIENMQVVLKDGTKLDLGRKGKKAVAEGMKQYDNGYSGLPD